MYSTFFNRNYDKIFFGLIKLIYEIVNFISFQYNNFIQKNPSISGSMLKLAKIDSIQKKINQYTYASTDSIGKGFSSQVYKGRNQQTDEQVAIKMIDMKNIKGDVHKTLLANQIEILKLLRSVPNILEFYDVFNLKSNTCIITELCQGGDLSKLLKAKKSLTQTQAVIILKQIINGYKGIFRFGIIHRDLKPANLFFVNGKVKIADFGFAVKQSNVKKESSYNVGSPVYMPLEALNQNMYSFKSDIWAIGVIFYQMLTGKTPWRAKSESDLKRQIKANPISSLLPQNISKQSAQFLRRTLQANLLTRMSPQQMQRFYTKSQSLYQENSISTTDSNQNNLFLTQKRQSQFRTRAISNQKDDRLTKGQTQYGKLPGQYMMGTNRNRAFLKGFGQTGMHYENLVRTTATMGKKTQSNFNIFDSKKNFDYLISQVHFCRFLFKLIDRINKSFNIDVNRKIRIKMTAQIMQKLKQTSQLKLMQSKNRQLFRKSPQFVKLLSIVSQYQQKYGQQLEIFVSQIDDFQREEGLSELIAQQVQTIFMFIQSVENPQEMADQVILLDYLITCRQLLQILQSSSLADFHSRAKIQAIVNGKPTKNITKDHIKAIKDKLVTMKLI